MELAHYLIPQETVLKCIILIILAIGVKVFIDCAKLKAKAKKNLAALDEANEANICDVTYLADSLKINNVDSKAYFDKFAEDRGKDADTEHLFDHLHAIYEAGHKSSRLDADLLVKNTVDKIFMGTDTIKTLISLFLVLGILGTLYGLAVSIGSFSGEGFMVNTDVKNTASELSKLFSNLRGAFAPSMFGVASTIFFVFYYTYFVQEKCINRLTEKLTTITINKWLPLLYPTDFQKGEISMTKLNDAVKDANKSLENQVAFVNKTQEMYDNLVETNETIKELRNVSLALKASSEAYQLGATKVTEVKETLDSISKKIENDNEFFRTYVNAQITSIKEMQKDTMVAVKETKSVLDESTDKNIKATSGLQNIQNDIVKAVSTPIQEQLGNMTSTITNDLCNINKSMESTNTVLNRINNPLETTAQQIQRLFRDTVEQIKKENAALTNAKAGLSAEQNKLYESYKQNGVGNESLEKKLDVIAKHLEKIGTLNKDSNVSTNQSGYMKYMPYIIVVLLGLSIFVQGLMAVRIADLQQTVINQSVVNDVRK